MRSTGWPRAWRGRRASWAPGSIPAADKLLLLATFVVLTLPNIGLVNRLPLWLTILVISRDVGIVLTVAIVNLAVGPRTFRPRRSARRRPRSSSSPASW